jgi:hypothetical protein
VADNFVANAGSGGSTFAADDIGPGVLHPRVKVEWGVDGTVNDTSASAPLPVQVITTTSGGATAFRLLSAASTNATSLKASAGKLMSLYACNLNAAVRYVKFYNKASAPTVGTDTPILTYPIPASTTGAGVVLHLASDGIAFSTGIAYATTTGVGDSDTGAVAANEVILNGSYI